MNSEDLTPLCDTHMRYDVKANAIICEKCTTAVETDYATFERHCRSKHRPCSIKSIRQVHEQLISRASQPKPEHLPYTSFKHQMMEWNPMPVIQGIPIVEGYKCPQCNMICGCEQTMRRHQRAEGHKSSSSAIRVPAQALWKLRRKRFFFPVLSGAPMVSEVRNELVDMLGADVSVHTNETREMADFVARNGSAEKLRKLGVTMEVAARLTSPTVRKSDSITIKIADELRHVVRHMFRDAETIISDGLTFGGDRLSMAIASPGVIEKTKKFKRINTQSSDRYACLISNVLMFFIRLWLEKLSRNKGLCDVYVRNDLLELCSKLYFELCNNSDRGSSCCKLLTKPKKKVVDIESYENHSEMLDDEESESCNDQDSDSNRGKNANEMNSETNETGHTPANGKNTTCREFSNSTELVVQVLRNILHEKLDAAGLGEPCAMVTFLTCRLVRYDDGKVRYCVGKEISHTLSALSYCASIIGVLSIKKWPVTGNAEDEVVLYEKMYQPTSRIALNEVQSLAAATRFTRAREEAVPAWSPCFEKSHGICGKIHGNHLTISEVGATIRKMQDQFFNDMFGRDGIFQHSMFPGDFLYRLKTLVDDHRVTKTHFCFVAHPENRHMGNICRSVISKLLTKIHDMDEYEKTVEIEKYIQRFATLAELLLCMIHLSGGTCGRVSELAFQSIRNTVNNPHRSLFLEEGRIVSIPTHRKQRMSDHELHTIVSRHPDGVTSDLFKLFILLIVPTRSVLRRKLHEIRVKSIGKEKAGELDMSADDYIVAEVRDRKGFNYRMARRWKMFGMDINASFFRQWAAGIGHVLAEEHDSIKFVENLDRNERNMNEDNEGKTLGDTYDLQQGHTLSTARKHYAINSCAHPCMKTFAQTDISKMKEASDLWIQYAGLTHRNVQERYGTHSTKNVEERNGKERDTISIGYEIAEQETPTNQDESHSDVGEKATEDYVTENPTGIDSVRRTVDIVMTENDSIAKRPPQHQYQDQEPDSNHGKAITERGHAAYSESDLQEALRLGIGLPHGSNVQFKSEIQKHAMETVMNKKRDVLIVDRTGGGKTAIVFGPALFQLGVTIFLAPLKTLRGDIRRRCIEMKIPYQEYRDINRNGDFGNVPDGLILISPEEVGPGHFQNIVSAINASGRLDRIVIDEIHLIWISDDFRSCMNKVHCIRPCNANGESIPMVCLSATVPPKYEEEILAAVGMRKENTKVMRGELRRWNVSINIHRDVFEFPRNKFFSSISNFVKNIVSKYTVVPARHVISVLTKGDADALSGFLQLNKYLGTNSDTAIIKHHSQMDPTEREQAINTWNQPEQHVKHVVMICTSGFGTGINSTNVLNAIVLGTSRSLFEFAQVLGRVGRNDENGSMHVFPNRKIISNAGCESEKSKILLKEAVQWFLTVEECRKVSLDNYFGSSTTAKPCNESETNSNETWCDNCFTWKAATKMTNPIEKSTKPLIHTNIQDTDDIIEHCTPLSAHCTEDNNSDSKEENAAVERKRTNSTLPEVENSPSKRLKLKIPSLQKGNDMIDEIRRISVIANAHCIPCLLKKGRAGPETAIVGGTKTHDERRCTGKRCYKCMSKDHFSSQCTTVSKARTNRCAACGLRTINGSLIHRYYGTNRNEFHIHRCPYKSLSKLILGHVNEVGNRRKLINDDIIPRKFGDSSALPELALWLVQDGSVEIPGYAEMAKIIASEYNLI